MSSQDWRELYRSVVRWARKAPRPARRMKYSDALIVAMFVWSVWHDRPQVWACQRENYDRRFRPRRLPSLSQFNRRIRSPRCQALLQSVLAFWAQRVPPTKLAYVDSRPLRVGECSKDRQAKAGHVYGGFARGYRLHAIFGQNGAVMAWEVASMNVAESRVARRLLRQVPPGCVLLADSNFDRTPLYEGAARRRALLLARPKRNAGRGHRRPSQVRLRSLNVWRAAPGPLAALRTEIERIFGRLSSFGGGLAPLPSWVRTLARVQRWVTAKLIIYHVRLALRKAAA